MSQHRLEGRVIVVSGAASGIGRATAARLASEGARVLACDVTAPGLEGAVSEVADAGGPGEAVARIVDVGEETDVAEAIADAVGRWGRLDGLVNAAGIHRTVRTHEEDLDSWNRILRVNATGTFLMCRAAIPHLISAGGAIVNFASTSTFFGHPWMGAYAASKGAIASLSQAMAVEYALDGVRVNCVAPGSVHSGITGNVTFPEDLSKAEGRLVRRLMSPTGFGAPEDVAGVIAMLLSDDGRHMTGEVIRIDGGTHA